MVQQVVGHFSRLRFVSTHVFFNHSNMNIVVPATGFKGSTLKEHSSNHCQIS